MCTTCLRVLLIVNSWMKEWKEWKSSFVIEISVSEWRQRHHVWLKEWMVDPSSTSWKQSSIEFVSKRSNIIADVLYWTGYFFFAIFGLIGYHFLHLKLNKKQETFWSEFMRRYLQENIYKHVPTCFPWPVVTVHSADFLFLLVFSFLWLNSLGECRIFQSWREHLTFSNLLRLWTLSFLDSAPAYMFGH